MDVLSELSAACETTVQAIPVESIQAGQREDVVISRVITLKQQNERMRYKDKIKESVAMKCLLRECPCLHLDKDGILRRRTTSRSQLVVPEKFKSLIYHQLHEEMGHLGADRMISLVRERFFWPIMRKEIENYVTKLLEPKETKQKNKNTSAKHNDIGTF